MVEEDTQKNIEDDPTKATAAMVEAKMGTNVEVAAEPMEQRGSSKTKALLKAESEAAVEMSLLEATSLSVPIDMSFECMECGLTCLQASCANSSSPSSSST
ncbi:hypothetical protein Nepgr_008607 [Nepenthes gracilis]|uniref:Uncharacterized protein n=1 Tax=Nepenthes gracilis TaxID=150966 RepID=A0AAD3S9T9_NEPGR|nr:hypothetical protein Nepgr_008607 [Nepenthes gracilis]